jgi:hypothetical protein
MMMKDPALARANYPVYPVVMSDLAPSMCGECLIDAHNYTHLQAQG